MTHGPADSSEYEVPDDEPLDQAELDRIGAISAHSRARLVHEAAMRRMTPMELFASGQARSVHADDRLVYDRSRQLPAAPAPAPDLAERLRREFALGWNEALAITEVSTSEDSSTPEDTPVDPYAADDDVIDAEVVE